MTTDIAVLNGPDELRAAVGKSFGPSEWITVSQEMINTFAEATRDFQWIHVDTERAKTQSPFGTTIAHGYLTLSLGPALLEEILTFSGFSMVLNYGLDRVRFPNPVPTGSNLRMTATVSKVDTFEGGCQTTMQLAFELQGQDKPACVADIIFRQYN